MTAPDPGTRLRTLLDRVPDTPKPLDAVVAAGERACRARRARLAGAGAAAAVVVVALASLVVAHPDGPTPSVPADRADRAALAGSWRVTSMQDGRGRDVDLSRLPDRVTMVFDPGLGEVSGQDGCNAYSGPYDHLGPALSFGSLASTARRCWTSAPLLARLDDVVGAEVADDSVALVDDAGRPLVRLDRFPEPPAEGPALRGAWSVEALVGRDGRGLLAERGRRPAVRFTPGPWPGEGMVDGRTYCNVVEGTYEQDGDQLRISSRIPGPVSLCLDVRLPERLAAVRHVTSSRGGDRLTLHAASWMIVAILDRDPDRVVD